MFEFLDSGLGGFYFRLTAPRGNNPRVKSVRTTSVGTVLEIYVGNHIILGGSGNLAVTAASYSLRGFQKVKFLAAEYSEYEAEAKDEEVASLTLKGVTAQGMEVIIHLHFEF